MYYKFIYLDFYTIKNYYKLQNITEALIEVIKICLKHTESCKILIILHTT